MLGGLVGVWNGVMSVLLDPLLHPNFVPTVTTLTLIGVPRSTSAFGTFGGWMGYTIWRPVQTDGPARPAQPVCKAGVARRRQLLTGRVAWFRVLLGAVVAAAGYMTAAAVFNFLIDFSAGRLTSDGWWQDRVVTWEIQRGRADRRRRGGLQHSQRPQTGPVRRPAGLVLPGWWSCLNSTATPGNRRPDRGRLLLPMHRRRLVRNPLFPPVVTYRSRRLGAEPMS